MGKGALPSCQVTCGQGGYIIFVILVGPKERRNSKWLHRPRPFFESPTWGQNQSAYVDHTILRAPLWAQWQSVQIALAIVVVSKAAMKERQGGKEKDYVKHGILGAHPGKVGTDSLLSWGLTSRQCNYITLAISGVVQA